jgi:hypothetical protein
MLNQAKRLNEASELAKVLDWNKILVESLCTGKCN